MSALLRRRRFWIAVLLGLLIVNLAVHWPWAGRTVSAGHPPGPPSSWPGGRMPEEMRARMDAALAKLPEEQRTALQARMEADRKFFDSLKTLPEAERRQKMQEHFASNPPPQIPGMERIGPPPGGAPGAGSPGENGAPGNSASSDGQGREGGKDDGQGGGAIPNHLPEPAVRRGLDQQIANSQKPPVAQ